MFEDPQFIEVFRSFALEFEVTGTTPNPKLPSRPMIHFRGHVERVHRMEGTVSVADDGTVRWNFVSRNPKHNLHSDSKTSLCIAIWRGG